MADQSNKVQFLEFHLPSLLSGDYVLRVHQELKLTAEHPTANLPPTTFPERVQRFAVQGARFGLSALDVRAVFPPAGSLGDHGTVLPHVVLERSTLPWERAAITPDDDDTDEDAERRRTTPWLALLLFDEDELDELGADGAPQVIKLGELKPPAGSNVHFPDFTRETGQAEDDTVAIIDVPGDLLRRIAPSAAELRLLAHVRRPIDDDGAPTGEELAIVIGNRLPRPGDDAPRPDVISVAHLVSVEERYDDDGFDFSGVPAGARVRLVSLKHWRFGCTSDEGSFDFLVKHLDRDPTHLQLPETILDPSVGAPEATLPARDKLQTGHVPLPHALRRGGTTVSWYRGPLAPSAAAERLDEPILAADQLLRLDPERGLLDVTYAAAWELGKLLMLQDEKVATILYRWKRTERQDELVRTLGLSHLPLELTAPRDLDGDGIDDVFADVYADVYDFFDRLARLEGVPFPYLVPDERILPAESLRLFRLDPFWIDCLWDGAYSIGRVLAGDEEHDRNLPGSPVIPTRLRRDGTPARPATVTGFLMRSEVVSGWPDMFVRAYGITPDQIAGSGDSDERVIPDDPHALRMLRRERLAPGVLLCLFDGEIRTLDVFLEPEALHFGFELNGETNEFERELRSRDGSELDATPVLAPLRQPRKDRVVDVQTLSTTLVTALLNKEIGFENGFTAAQFALQMIAGTEKIRFLHRGEPVTA